MRTSAGISIILNNHKILVAKPKNASWWERYTPPKGNLEPGESLADAASRETFEEVGIYISPSNFDGADPVQIDYSDKKGNVYKRVYLFEYPIKSISDLKLDDEILPKIMLQKEEIEDARFMTKEECSTRVLKRYLPYISERLFN